MKQIGFVFSNQSPEKALRSVIASNAKQSQIMRWLSCI